jgi:superfamily II DNA helicase RecQ
MSHIGPQKLYKDIVDGKFHQVIISPEIVVSESFQKEVLSEKKFHQRLQAMYIDEAHYISLWGGSFHPDYASLGVLQGWFLSNVPVVVASATLPEHILDDIKWKLRLSTSVQKVSVSNAQPNVALSVRKM